MSSNSWLDVILQINWMIFGRRYLYFALRKAAIVFGLSEVPFRSMEEA